MRRKDRLPELLSPAGDMESLIAAVRAGADAVYVGGKLYSARSYAKNFDIDELKSAVAYCHLHGVRLYVTVNTLLYEEELTPALLFARELYRIGVDALIVCDLGLISMLREYLPELELHASTQMSVHNSYGADMAARLGCQRVVLARELSSTDMAATIDGCIPECEVFLHGALCVCHSGQCLFSSMVGGRSGNRGECAQPCRLPYYKDGREYYPLSLSDLSLAHHIPELVKMGVASLKIEGRMKSPEYVYTVTSVYRRLLDECRASTKGEDERLARAFSRGGFTDGYFRGNTEGGMTGVRTEADKSLSREMDPVSCEPIRVPTLCEVEIRLGEPARMTLRPKFDTGIGIGEVTVYGDVADVARSSPLDEDSVKARLSKMGGTYLSLDREDITLTLDDGVNLSPASINKLRRSAVEAFTYKENEVAKRPLPATSTLSCEYIEEIGDHARESAGYRSTAMLYNTDMLGAESLRSFDKVFIPIDKLGETDRGDIGVALPPVVFESEIDEVLEMLGAARERGITDALVTNIGEIEMCHRVGILAHGDFRLNVMNRRAALVYSQLGIDTPTLSPELTLPETRRMEGRVVVYGRLPLMITERCFVRESFGCEACGRATLTDRRGESFPILREYKHRNIILNSAVTYIADKEKELTRVKFKHYIFTLETPREIDMVMEAERHRDPLPLNLKFRRIGKRKIK